jgi:hypothetical protein
MEYEDELDIDLDDDLDIYEDEIDGSRDEPDYKASFDQTLNRELLQYGGKKSRMFKTDTEFMFDRYVKVFDDQPFSNIDEKLKQSILSNANNIRLNHLNAKLIVTCIYIKLQQLQWGSAKFDTFVKRVGVNMIDLYRYKVHVDKFI